MNKLLVPNYLKVHILENDRHFFFAITLDFIASAFFLEFHEVLILDCNPDKFSLIHFQDSELDLILKCL